MSIELYKHNQEAYENAVSTLSACKKAAIVHPTGTGKSFIGFKLCDENQDERICWLSPSEYIFKTQIENIKKVAPDFTAKNIIFIVRVHRNGVRVSKDCLMYIKMFRCWGYPQQQFVI